MTKPTREEVLKFLDDWAVIREDNPEAEFEGWYDAIVSAWQAYLAQEEELKDYEEKIKNWYDALRKSQAENQALKASMEADYIERQAKHIQELVKENEALKELAKGCAAKPRAMQDLMKKHGLAIRDHDDPMQKLAFTLYTEVVESAVSARDLLEGEQP